MNFFSSEQLLLLEWQVPVGVGLSPEINKEMREKNPLAKSASSGHITIEK